MNIIERIIILALTLFDLIMDLVTLGAWTRVRGNETIDDIKVKHPTRNYSGDKS